MCYIFLHDSPQSLFLFAVQACRTVLAALTACHDKCRFKLKALAGHSKAGQKVTYGALKGARFKQLALVWPPFA